MYGETLDVLVIGAGQAGLAMGYYLRPTSLRFRLVDRQARLGESWRQRYDSLVLFTPRSYSALPGLPVPGDPDSYPTKDEIADYLASYARHFDLPVTLGTGIHRLEHVEDLFRVTTDGGAIIESRAVVLATGAFQTPAIPSLFAQLASEVCQLTPETYRNPSQVPGERVLVVGDGATGRQIAAELAATREVLLATGRPRKVFPERILGRTLFWWLDKLGVLQATRESLVGRYLMESDSFPGRNLALSRLRSSGVEILGRMVSATGRQVAFADGSTAVVDAVIWATGYREETEWVRIPEAKGPGG